MNEHTLDITNRHPGVDEILNFYTHNFFCKNCQTINHRYIRKGINVPPFVRCENCECRTDA